MAKTEELSSLLSSLTPSEKRYVRIFAEKHQLNGRNNYLELFETLSASEGNLKKGTGDKFSYSKKRKITSSQKSYLYTFILKAMRSFHEERNIDTGLREALLSSAYLFEKKLYAQSLKMIRRARVRAVEFDRHLLQAELLQLEMEVLAESGGKNAPVELDLLSEKLSALLHLLPGEFAAAVMQQRIRLLQNRHEQLPAGERGTYNKQLARLMKQGRKGESFTLLHHGLYSQARYLHCHGRLKDSARTYEQLLQLWEEYPLRVKRENMVYKKIIFNYLIVCHALERFESYPRMLARVRAVSCNNTEEEAEQFQLLQQLELLFMMNTGGYDQLPAIEEKIKNGLEKYRNKISKAHELAFYHNMAVAHFICENWKTASNWLEKIIAEQKTQQRLDLQHFARLLQLVLWYESGHYDLLDYGTTNARRYLKSKGSWSLFESCITRLLEKLPAANPATRRLLFEKALPQLSKIKSNPGTAGKPGLDELLCWVLSRKSGNRILETVNARLK